MQRIDLIGGYSVDRAVQVNGQRSINLYPEREGDGAKASTTLKSTPGLASVQNGGNGPTRSAMVTFQDSLYWVSGGELYKMTAAEVMSSIGSLNTNSGRCYIAAGRDYLLVVDGGDGYTYDGSTFAAVSDGDFPGSPGSATYLDGFFIVHDVDTDEFYVSSLEDPTAWAALDFATAEASPDDVEMSVATLNNLYAVGTLTTQAYYNSGNADFPFSEYANGTIEWGTLAPASVVLLQGALLFLGQSSEGGRSVVMISGFTPTVVSDPDTSFALDQMATVSDAEGSAYKQSGQSFYVLTFPTEARTFVYHVESGRWHERDWMGSGRWRVSGLGYFNGKVYAGDYEDGRVYTLSLSTYEDGGLPIHRRRVSQVIHTNRRRLSVSKLEIEFEAGVGLTSGQGSDPKAMLRYSRDGGKTWSNELWRDIGQIGEYQARTMWTRLGEGYQFVFDIRVTDPVPVNLVNAYAEIEVRDR